MGACWLLDDSAAAAAAVVGAAPNSRSGVISSLSALAMHAAALAASAVALADVVAAWPAPWVCALHWLAAAASFAAAGPLGLLLELLLEVLEVVLVDVLEDGALLWAALAC